MGTAGTLGDGAMMADLGPAMLGKAQGAVGNSDDARSILVNALKGRNAGTEGRLNAEVDQAFGPAQSTLAYAKALKEQGGAAASALPGILNSAGPVDIGNVLANLNRGAKTAVGPEATAIGQAKNWLTREIPPVANGLEHDPLADPALIGSPPPEAPPPDGDLAPRPVKPTMPRPQSLVNFLQEAGGVRDPGGDLKSMGLDRFPGLVRASGGLSPDMARQAAAQAGYLGGHIDTAMADTNINDLFNALENHPHHSVFDDEAAGAWDAYNSEVESYQAQGRAQSRSAAPRRAPLAAYQADDPLAPAPPSTGPIDDASTIHNAKKAFDNVIRYGSPGLNIDKSAVADAQGAFKQARGGVNDALREQVPGYADTMDTLSNLMRSRQALKDGKTGAMGLSSSDATLSPEEFDNHWDSLGPDQQEAFRVGTRALIDKHLGTKGNDLQALKTELQGEGGWNTEKLKTIFGDEETGRIVNAVDREKTFRDTYNKVVEGSQTDLRAAARQNMKPDVAPSAAPIVNPTMSWLGAPLTAVKRYAVQPLWEALTHHDPTKDYGDLANVMTATGPARDAHLAALIDALQRQKGFAPTANASGNAAALAAGLLAHGVATQPLRSSGQRQNQ